jgi:predicted MFS family arabinose efflux permease
MQNHIALHRFRPAVGCFAALYGVGYLSYILSPVVIGSVVEGLRLDAAQAGLLASVELGALAISVILLAGRMATIDRRRLALAGIGLVVIGHASSALAGSLWFLLPCRAIAGLGLGAMIATGNAAVATTSAPQRQFAIAFTMGQFQAAALLLFVLPVVVERWSYSGAYGFLAIWSLLMLPLLRLLPERENAQDDRAPVKGGAWQLFLLPTVIAMMLIGASDSSVWTFTERIALQLGLSLREAGSVLAVALIAGVAGSLAAAILGTRFGERTPILIASIVLATAYYAVATATSAAVYSSAQVTVIGCYGFVIPYLFGVNGRLDPTGRIMVAGSAAHLIGAGMGPLIAGQIIQSMGYAGVGSMVAAMTVACALLFFWRLGQRVDVAVR